MTIEYHGSMPDVYELSLLAERAAAAVLRSNELRVFKRDVVVVPEN